jgi:predicted metal-dependent hydrolase
MSKLEVAAIEYVRAKRKVRRLEDHVLDAVGADREVIAERVEDLTTARDRLANCERIMTDLVDEKLLEGFEP